MKMTEIIKGIAQMYCSNMQEINPEEISNISYKQNMHPIWLHLNPNCNCQLLKHVLKHVLHEMSWGIPPHFTSAGEHIFMHLTVKSTFQLLQTADKSIPHAIWIHPLSGAYSFSTAIHPGNQHDSLSCASDSGTKAPRGCATTHVRSLTWQLKICVYAIQENACMEHSITSRKW